MDRRDIVIDISAYGILNDHHLRYTLIEYVTTWRINPSSCRRMVKGRVGEMAGDQSRLDARGTAITRHLYRGKIHSGQ